MIATIGSGQRESPLGGNAMIDSGTTSEVTATNKIKATTSSRYGCSPPFSKPRTTSGKPPERGTRPLPRHQPARPFQVELTMTELSPESLLAVHLRGARVHNLNSTARCWRCSWLMTVPSAMSNAANRLVIPLRW